MKYLPRISAASIATLATLSIAAAPAGGPAFENESIRFSINWPSGLSLGESQLRAVRNKATADAPEKLHLEFDLEAAIPGFTVADHYRSDTSPEFCSAEFQKKTSHGKKKVDEKSTFDQHALTVTRETAGGGGKTDLKASQCARDALTFLYYVRRELIQGRVPAQQTVFFGAPYDVRMEFAGTQMIHLGDTQVEADRFTTTAKGAASEVNFEIFFLKDKTRTPALVRVPLQLGAFFMELVR